MAVIQQPCSLLLSDVNMILACFTVKQKWMVCILIVTKKRNAGFSEHCDLMKKMTPVCHVRKYSSAQIFCVYIPCIANSETLQGIIFSFLQHILWTYGCFKGNYLFFIFEHSSEYKPSQTFQQSYYLIPDVPFIKLKKRIDFSIALEFECYASGGLEPILVLITSCFSCNPVWFTSANTLSGEEIYQGSRSALSCTSDHNTMKYTGSMPKSQKTFVTHDRIIYSPDTVFSGLFFSLPVFLSLCFPCSFVKKCFFICFAWLRRETQASQHSFG